MRSAAKLTPAVLAASLACGGQAPAGADDDGADPLVCSNTQSTSIYDRRIAPLLDEERPSTCNECHLAGIDLSIYVQSSPCKTMACMDEQGLVDFAEPSASLVLSWIERAEPAGLITADVIEQEHQGVLEWIEFMAACGESICPPYQRPCGHEPSEDDCDLTEPEGPGEYVDPGDCSDPTIERLWYENVYRWRRRCYPCHFDTWMDEDSIHAAAPPWIATGECNEASLRTLRNAQERGLLDVDDPLQSLLLLKPLAEELGGVEHGGDDKIHTTAEPTYIDFVNFLTRYAACN